MTLWQLLTSLCFVMPIAFAAEAANAQKATATGYIIAIIAGIVVAFCTAFLFWKAGALMRKLPGDQSPLSRVLTTTVIVVLSLVWIGTSGWCGEKLAMVGLSRMR